MYNFSKEELIHYGIKGMRWGVRRKRDDSHRYHHRNELDNSVVKTKNGTELKIVREPTPRLTQMIAKMDPKTQKTLANSDIMRLTVKGENVGDLQLYKESPKSLNVVWVSVKSKHEGAGYGTAALQGVINYAKKTDLDEVTLEVPGNSPNARHIYEKLGFKEDKVISSEDDAWGGLTVMKLNLKDKK